MFEVGLLRDQPATLRTLFVVLFVITVGVAVTLHAHGPNREGAALVAAAASLGLPSTHIDPSSLRTTGR